MREIADGLKIRNARKMAKEDLVYRILDAEAVIDSQKEPEKPKRRGRPKKKCGAAGPAGAGCTARPAPA